MASLPSPLPTLLLATVLGMGSLACKTPCPIRAFQGRPVGEFIRKQGPPVRVLQGPEGTGIYLFEGSDLEADPTPSVQAEAQPRNPRPVSDGWGALFQTPSYTAGRPPTVPRHAVQSFWILAVRTDAQGLIKDYQFLSPPGK